MTSTAVSIQTIPVSRSSAWFPWLLAAVGAFAIFFQLGDVDITSANEGQRGTPPIEMLQTGDFVIPTINGEVYIVKPPLLYWAIAALYAATGVIDEATARAPTALCGLVLLLSVYFYARRAVGETEARWSATLLLATPFFLRRAQVSDLDMPLALACFLAIVAMWSAMESRGRKRWALATAAGVAFGAALLLKGPVPFLFLLPAWAAHRTARAGHEPGTLRLALIWTAALLAGDWILKAIHFLIRNSTPALVDSVLTPPYGLICVMGLWLWLAWRASPGDRQGHTGVLALVVAVGVALSLPWIIAVLTRLGWEFTSGVLQQQAIERTYSASRINSGAHGFYLAGLTYCMAPWSLLAPLLLFPRLRPAAPAWVASGLTAAVTIAVFSLVAGKEQDYILPAYPFLAIALGGVVATAVKGIDERATRYLALWSSIVMPGLGIGALGIAIYASRIYPGEYNAVTKLWIGTAAVFVALWSTRRAGRRPWGVALATLFLMAQLHILDGAHRSGARSIQDVALAMRELKQMGFRVEASDVQPAEAFYLRTRIPTVRDPQAVAERMHGDEPYYYLCRARYCEAARAAAGTTDFRILTEYYSRSRYALAGNHPLPESVGRNLRLRVPAQD